MIRNKNKQTWHDAKSLRLSLGHGNETEEKFMRMALGVGGDDEEDGRFVAGFFVHDEDLNEFVLNAIELGSSRPLFKAALVQDDSLTPIREFLKPIYLTLLQKEHLQGYGYILPRKIDDMPAPIPEDVWFGEVDWASSTVTGGGLSFASVRVTSMSETDDTDMFSIVMMSVEPPGRPTKKSLILEAFEYGIKEELLDFSDTNTAIYHNIRELIKTIWPDKYCEGKGLQDGALQKHLATLIDANKQK